MNQRRWDSRYGLIVKSELNQTGFDMLSGWIHSYCWCEWTKEGSEFQIVDVAIRNERDKRQISTRRKRTIAMYRPTSDLILTYSSWPRNIIQQMVDSSDESYGTNHWVCVILLLLLLVYDLNAAIMLCFKAPPVMITLCTQKIGRGADSSIFRRLITFSVLRN